MPKLILATTNPGKIRELSSLLAGTCFQLTTPMEEGLDDVVVAETGTTMEENAELKAVTYAIRSGLTAIADDSGLGVDALDGRPGILSARYAGENTSDEEKIEHLLAELEGVPWEKRTAHFRCTIAIATPGGEAELCQGECRGLILTEPRGSCGFDYDPIFYIPELGKTMAELTLEEKNRISHRWKAARGACKMLESMNPTLRESGS